MIAWRAPLAAFLAGAGLVGYVMYLQADAAAARHENALSYVRASVTASALAQVGTLNLRIAQANTAVEALRKDQHENNETLRAALAGLRSDTGGLRQHVSDLHSRLERATPSTVQHYASTCARLFADLADEGAEMAAEGAAISRAAGGHLADDTHKRLSWPSDPSRALSKP